MADITVIGTALTSLKTAVELAKAVRTSASSLEQAEVNLQIAELISALADARIEVSEIQSLLLEKEILISKLQKEIENKVNTVFEEPYYWLENDGQRDGPYCQRCKDVDHLFVRLQSASSKGRWTCRACKEIYIDGDYVAPQKRRRVVRSGF
ncbi:hypothetical protein [Vibrio parahaemolyticus]|uniref:hypothetical protein n=1 Tax=Vibrio parahaemolyticus TaxID=670 RepID=UPI000471F4A1|nr:hypothetical protein [Vibrio parahaemolyticus]EJG0767684.1 hypothetical protein [Vibrio parahaemolyticus O5:K30]HAT8488917.1 hypothetical protein [Vibrio vulnificus]EIE9609474.1 hypothetical protein [Vibrio parahaemolyticus]EIO4097937.1 hypothetical protein [Vibrio parahaemolyticus]EIY9802862.1 hypothetical protein [Vibrio parahaemolyticus]